MSSHAPSAEDAWPSWPEDPRVTEETLDPARIAEQGESQLYRALNTQHLIAFVGSGVSAAYGRVSWPELVLFHVQQLKQSLEDENRKDKLDATRRDLLQRLLDCTDDGNFICGEQIMPALMLCEQLWRLTPTDGGELDLEFLADRFSLSGRLAQLRSAGSHEMQRLDWGSELFRTWIKRETHNEIPHVLRVLAGADRDFVYFLEQLCDRRPSDLAPEISRKYTKLAALSKTLTALDELDRSNVEKCSRLYASLFSNQTKGMHSWLQLLDPIYQDSRRRAETATDERDRRTARAREHVHRYAITVLKELAADAGSNPVSPVRYFVFGLVLDLLRLGGEPADAMTFLEDILNHVDDYSPDTFRQRDSLIPRSADPLHEMAYGLGMHRFATTNYDLEIERFFHDVAFAPPPPLAGDPLAPSATSIRVGPIGGRTRDFVLSDQTVADLIDFATDDNAYSLEVVHLHGRATHHDPIVVTERDYQSMYLRDGRLQSAVNEAREAAFGGNPVLFVGFGMSESDVLRPLREVASGSVRRNRALIALLPADKTRSENDSFTMDQYVKHGVSVIRYDLEDQRSTSGWLHTIFVTIKDLTDAMRKLAKAARSGLDGQTLPASVLTAVSNLQWAVLNKERRRFHSSKEACKIDFEINLLHDFTALCQEMARRDAHKFTATLCGQIAPALLERVKVAIQTAALCSKLAAISNAWKQWWRNWQQTPLDRGDFRRYSVLRSPNGSIWSRHRVNERPDKVVEAPPSWDPSCLPKMILKGRRCMVITSRKGAGKGNLYSYLTSTWENSRKLNVIYLGQFFTTFGYDCEIASVWDALPMFLLSPAKFPLLGDPQPPEAKQENAIWEQIQQACGITRKEFKSWSRRERLDRALRVARRQIKLAAANRSFRGKKLRLLIAFNVFDVLLEADGSERQGEIRDIFSILFSNDHKDLPLDLFFVVRDTHLPAWFRHLPKDARPADARGEGLCLVLSKKHREHCYFETVRATLERSHANLVETQRDCTASFAVNSHVVRAMKKSPKRRPGRNLLYVLPPPDPAQFNLDDFKEPTHLDRSIKDFIEGTLRERWPQDHEISQLHGFFQHHLGSNRYAYMLVIMIARDILRTVPKEKAAERYQQLDEVMCAIELMPRSSEGVSDKFFEIVLDYWFARRRDPLKAGSDDPVLHEFLIRHLAVMSMPVRAHVLSQCPQIRKHLKIPAIAPLEIEEEKEKLVNEALEELVERGLVFRIDSPPVGNRYQVHRSIRMHVYRRLGSQHSDPTTAHIFGPSLYAAQTRNFPRLNPSAYAFLCELVDKLSSYPQPLSKRLEHCGSEQERKRERKIVAHCLRAALGVMRTLCSLGVVTRFADAEGLPTRSAAQTGYLEHHRLVLRWMIKLAAWLDAGKPFVYPPFYRDETVWLYNECGVFSYAQGRCYDARALFERALKLQGEIEGVGGGPMRRRILLNAGLNAIDAGRLTIARRAFEEVECLRHDDSLTRLLAVGFMGFVDHLSGELSKARDRYSESLAGLKDLKRIRPMALIKQYSGYLYMHLDDFDNSRKEFRDAIQLAEAGGYADLAHYARLAEAKAYVRDPDSDHRIDSARRRIQAAQDYADRMDIPRLIVDVLLFRGEILLQQGETTLAGQLIARGLQIANLNGMMFRRIFAMEWLSAVYEARNNHPAAAQLRAGTLRAARSMGYHSSVFRTNRVLF